MSFFAAQIPQGALNGINGTFTITANTSGVSNNVITSFELYRNGLLMGIPDYTFTTNTLPVTGTQTAGTEIIIIVLNPVPQPTDILNSWIWQQ